MSLDVKITRWDFADDSVYNKVKCPKVHVAPLEHHKKMNAIQYSKIIELVPNYKLSVEALNSEA